MRIAVLMTGLTAYQDSCFRQLAELGDELLLVHPAAMAFAPFDPSVLSAPVRRHIWDEAMPSADVLVPLVEDFAPDVVIMWSWDGAGYRAVMKAQRGRALRVIFTSNFWHGSPKQYAGVLAARAYVQPLFDVAWVPGERSEAFARLIGFAGKDIIRGANSADTPLFDRGPRDGAELASRRRFVFTGRLIWHKAPTELAAAYRRYRELVEEPWDLAVAGGGPLAAEFEGIPGVELHGFLQPGELSELMHRSSCLILPSHIEWYGVVVHEGAAAGLPLIVSDGVGAITHMLQDNYNGHTVPAGDVDELAEAMRRISAAPAARLGEMSAGSNALSRRLSPTIWARNLHEELSRRLPAATVAAVPCDCCGGVERQPLFRENGILLTRCRECDLHSIAELPAVDSRMTEMEAGHYAGELSVLDATKQLESERVLTDRFRAYVTTARDVVPAGHWLDIGCGAGLLLTVAAEAGYDISGIELTADRRAAAERVTGATVYGAPLEELALPDASMDVISMINVFSHLVSPTGTFAEIRRVLRPGGILVLATGEMTSGVAKGHMHNWNLGDHLHFLGDRTMRRYADKLGYEVVDHRRVWLPEEMYTKEWLQMRGRDPRKNLVKSAILHTPGAFPAFRSAMLHHQRGSAAHSATYVLRRPAD